MLGLYLLATALCALFGAVYERFSHGVYSYFMIYAFACPLLLGAIPFFLLLRSGRPLPCRGAMDCIHAGVSALTVGCVMTGVLEIYGTTNPLTLFYWVAGGALLAVGWLLAATLRA